MEETPKNCFFFFFGEACRDKLKSRGHVLVNRFFLCMNAEETHKHLLLWCPVAYGLWFMIYGLMGINWVIAGSIIEELWAWEGLDRKRNTVKPLTVF